MDLREEIAFGRFRLLTRARSLYDGERRLKLGSRALEILLALAERAGDLVTKQELVARVWPGVHVDDGALRVHVAALRKVLGDDPAAPQFIFNVAGQGYRLIAPTTQLPRDDFVPDSPWSGDRGLANRLIGREVAIESLIGSLQQSRFVTITGPGGIGKTTVALAIAERLSRGNPDRTTLVDLALLTDPKLLPSTLASALRLRVSSSDPTDELIAWLRTQQRLLLLDSCEHLVDAAAALAEQIMQGAPNVSLLTTSREPLRAEGEWVTRLPPLGLPPRDDRPGPTQALQSPAVQLFLARATAADSTFAIDNDNAASVIDICYRLDGIPLAIEFAASRVGAFGAKELLARLDDRFALLASGRRIAPVRHRTLRAMLDWSHDFLSEPERILFRRLAVFRGAFTLDAVEAAATAPGIYPEGLLDGIAGLVAKSLLSARVEPGIPRYRLLETIRAYALEKLRQSGDGPATMQRLAEYLGVRLESAEGDWKVLLSSEWDVRYAYLIDDVRAALEWAFSAAGDALLGISLCVSSSPLWFSLGLIAEYRSWAQRALQGIAKAGLDEPDAEMRLNVLLASATLNTEGPFSQRAGAYERALAIASRLGNSEYQLRSLWGLAGQRYLEGDYNGALTLCQRFDTVAEGIDDGAARLVRDRMMALGLHLVGRQTDARPYGERALTHPAARLRSTHRSFQEYDSQVASRSHLARILWVQGFPDRAAAIAAEGVAQALPLNYPPPLCYIIAFAACPIALWMGDIEAARRYADMMRGPAASLSFSYWRSWHQIYDVVTQLEGEIDANALPEVLDRLGDVARQPLYADVLVTLRPEFAGADAFARATEGAAGWCAPEIFRARGAALLRQGQEQSVSQAVALLRRSLDLARSQGARSWELRSAISLARVYRKTHGPAAAHDTLDPVYGCFTEGFSTADMRRAATLLKEIAA